jgi:protein required for attachment to host cells
MLKLSIPAGGHVVVCDGSKVLLLVNAGDAKFPNLRTAEATEIDNPPTREQGTDRPSRVFESVGGRRSGAEQPDLHDRREEAFAREIADKLEGLRMTGKLTSLVVVAPPRMLADLRRFLPDQTMALVAAQIDKDLTNHPIHEIEKHLTGG